MATVYFWGSQDNDGDPTNPDDWSTTPTGYSAYGQVPQAGDTAYVANYNTTAFATTSWTTAADVYFIGNSSIGGYGGANPWTLPSGFSVSANSIHSDNGITWGGASPSQTINAAGSQFTADPGVAINGTSGCNYNCNVFYGITDDGTGTFNSGYTYGGAIIYPATLSVASTFNGNVTCNAISAGTFAGSIGQTVVVSGAVTGGIFWAPTQNSVVLTAASISGITFGGSYATVNCSGTMNNVTFTSASNGDIAVNCNDIENCSTVNGIQITFTNSGGDGLGTAITLIGNSGPATFNWPTHNYSVTFPTQFGSGTFTTAIPARDQVEDGVNFGTSASVSGLLPAGGGTRGYAS